MNLAAGQEHLQAVKLTALYQVQEYAKQYAMVMCLNRYESSQNEGLNQVPNFV